MRQKSLVVGPDPQQVTVGQGHGREVLERGEQTQSPRQIHDNSLTTLRELEKGPKKPGCSFASEPVSHCWAASRLHTMWKARCKHLASTRIMPYHSALCLAYSCDRSEVCNNKKRAGNRRDVYYYTGDFQYYVASWQSLGVPA
jgi:hypothetical protein